MIKRTGLVVGLFALTVGIGLSCGPEKTNKTADKIADEANAGPQEVRFAANAFPPTIPDTPDHENAWLRSDCLRCHETGVDGAQIVRHAGMSPILLKAKCRSCHVFIRGEGPREAPKLQATDQPQFAANAFPPMIPNNEAHADAWTSDNCLDCHRGGRNGAPRIRHRNLSPLTMRAKCRTCHVQIRAAGIDDPM